MTPRRRRCPADKRRQGVVSAIVKAGRGFGGQRRPHSDLTQVTEFFPNRSSLPERLLEQIQEQIRCRCWCKSFRPVLATNTVGQLERRVYYQHKFKGGRVKQSCSPDECCT
jgi:hypothetical protein